MAFKSNNLEVKGVSQSKANSSLPPNTKTTENVELSHQELEFLLVTIKNGLFKGEYIELLYNLTLKLQTHYSNFKK